VPDCPVTDLFDFAMPYRSSLVALVACVALSACDGKHPLHGRTEVEIREASSHCEVIAGIEQVRVRLAESKSLLRGWTIQTQSGNCLLLLSHPGLEPPAVGSALGLRKLDDPILEHRVNEVGESLAECQPVGGQSLPACPAHLSPLP
jgi:hypothetical protein